MLDRTDDSSVAADTWLAQFEEALGKPDEALLTTLFHPDSYWRDVLALSWNIQTINGADAILKALPPLAHRAGPSGFAIAPDRAASASIARAATLTRGIFVDRTGSTCARHRPNMPATIRPSSSSAADNPDSPSPRG